MKSERLYSSHMTLISRTAACLLTCIAATMGPESARAQEFAPTIVVSSGSPESTAEGGTSGGPQRYLLVSSFVCFQPGCQSEDAVLRYDADTGAFLGVHVSNVPGPTGLAIHPVTGHLLVACRDTDEVREYDAQTGAFLGTFVEAASGGLHLPQSLIFKSDGNLLVTSNQTANAIDRVNGIIEYNGTTGDFVRVFVNGGLLGTGCGSTRCLYGPNGMAFGPNGHLYVASSINDLVIEYDGVSGAFLNYFDTSILDFPVGIAIRPATGIRPGNILVTSRWVNPGNPNDTHKILEFDKTTLELISPGGTFATGLDDPGPLMWAIDGTLLVADRTLWDVPPNFSDKIVKRNATTGAFVSYATAATDTHLHYGTGLLYVTFGCMNASQCNDNNPCTDDTCDGEGVCQFTNDNTNNPDDGLFCNGVETACVNGEVVHGTPPNCNDGINCTTDTCNEETNLCNHIVASGQCMIDGVCYASGAVNPANDCQACTPATSQTLWTNRAAGTSCGSPVNTECNLPDSCNSSGACLANLQPAGTACGSNVNNDCTDPDTCNGSGACLVNNAADHAPCSDGMACTQTDECSGGICVGRDDPCNDPSAPICLDNGGGFDCVECLNDIDCEDDGLECTIVSCHLATHTCVHTPSNAFCSDGLFCNGAETCNAETGECEPASSPCAPPLECNENTNMCVTCFTHQDCDDGLVCNGQESCVLGNCLNGTPIVNCCKDNADCDNDNICDGFETCVTGECQTGTPLDCGDSNDCTTDTCDPTEGCSNVDKPLGAACNDQTESPCNHADTCNGEGVCQNNQEPNGTSCSDGKFCNGEEVCDAGVCTSGTVQPNCCDTDDDCTNNNICDGLERCIGLVCVPGTPLNCDPGEPCLMFSCHTVFGCQITAAPITTPCGNQNSTPCDLPDTCDGEGSCRANRLPNGTSCTDGNPCNGSEVCQGFVCQPGIPIPNCCDDNSDCNNGNVCDGLETCNNGQCMPGTPLNCEDGNPCTNNTCSPTLGCQPATLNPAGTMCGSQRSSNCDNPDTCNAGGVCQSNNVPNGTSCADVLNCNGTETCQSGVCAPGTPVPNCCRNNLDCNNSNPCDGTETCVAGTCVPGTPMNCNDNNPCTDDFCTAQNGCGHVNNSSLCNDGNVCTSFDMCMTGACVGGGSPPDCNGDGCTDCNSNDVRDDCESLADCDNDDVADLCEPFGDADSDCDVDLRDIAAFQSCFSGDNATIPPTCQGVDTTLDTDIEIDDLIIILGNYQGP